ncbi:hypothetical protein [Methylibium sp.]|uniref:hypothetical protein n=1 Tax=Methylibium sp. TaxID=2067992 RepID=UPI003D144AF6
MTNDWIDALNRSLRWAVTLVLKLTLTLAGLVFMLGVVVLGLTVGVTLVIWALLQGKRPVAVRFGRQPGADWSRFRAAATRRSPSPAPTPSPGEVVDVEAREITDQRPRAD